MTNHLTVRMAWHDNNWDGNICKNPEKNYYCIGTHSLLSARIKKNKVLKTEGENKGAKLDSIKDYIPPCFWSSNAFSSKPINVVHKHPIPKYETKINPIHEILNPYSVFSWPFKLSFNHSEKKREKEGSYPPDLNNRIKRFIDKFEPKKSIVFFYLNYDNPILDEGENNKYVLLGCALLSENWKREIPKDYAFSEDELAKARSNKIYKNFPKISWNIQFSYDFINSGILLPYKEYLDYKDKYEDGEEKLNEMRVLIEEESLISSFKYVAMDIDDDKCIYLLNKIRKSIQKIREHNIPNLRDFSREAGIIENLLDVAWKNRSLYPSLAKVIDTLINKDVDDIDKIEKGNEIIQSFKKLNNDEDLLDVFIEIVLSSRLPKELSKFKREFSEIKKQIKYYDIDLIKKLCLFNLTLNQIERILDSDVAFLNPQVSKSEIIKNPYILCEAYLPKEFKDYSDLDQEDLIDEPIDFFKIDIGMFPQKFLGEKSELQNLALKSPERLRALVREYLHRMGEFGHCFRKLEDIYQFIVDYPLFFGESKVGFDKSYLCAKDQQCFLYFLENLEIVESENGIFYYLKELFEAEKLVKKFVTDLLSREDYEWDTTKFVDYVNGEKDGIKSEFSNFNNKGFVEERLMLLNSVFHKSVFVISGRAGSGKTYVLRKIVKELKENGEEVLLLAPTGKAALRLKDAAESESYTIDRYIYIQKEATYGRDYLKHFENIIFKPNKPKIQVENVIIDESSMVDLQKLATLLSMFESSGDKSIKRLIFVGDEFQLPPIGFGKPFYDIIQYLTAEKNRKKINYIRLMTNCRNGFDESITEFADIFSDNPYYEEKIDEAHKGGKLSNGLEIIKWESEERLNELLNNKLLTLLNCKINDQKDQKTKQLNLFLGLRENGTVDHYNFDKTLKLDKFQIITPYKSQFYGNLAINEIIQSNFRESDICLKSKCIFYHADKIICINNWYKGWGERRRLLLSNGSIGIVKNDKKDYKGNCWSRHYYFPFEKELDTNKARYFHNDGYSTEFNYENINEEDDFELAYSITVHKAQGSDFEHVIVVIPRRQALISRELIYTALTRSRKTVTVLLQETEYNLLEKARDKSQILKVNSSIFENPDDWKKRLFPEPGVKVESYQEYCIYKKLKEKDINFGYEDKLKLKGIPVKIKPDFTIYDENHKPVYYWEHLGILNKKWYAEPWQRRKKAFEKDGFSDSLITTDALGGFEDEILDRVIEDIKSRKLKSTNDSKFSKHHYTLY